jgi:hypothetical protein
MTVMMLIRTAILVLAISSVAAQMSTGEIAGQIVDESRSPLPGVRITMTINGQTREAVTSGEGRFVFDAVMMGTYRVTAKLAGFAEVSGEIALLPAAPRAFLLWPLRVGCISAIQRVIFSPREAARLVEAIVHVRVIRDAGPVRISNRPDCQGWMFHEYQVEILSSVPGPWSAGPQSRQMFLEPRDPRLTSGQHYIALLWPDGYSTGELVLPVVSGRVVSSTIKALGGATVDEALRVLSVWAKERR